MTNVMYQDLTVKNTLDATSIGAGLIAAIRDALMPVGSVVCCTTSPAGVVGGSWAQIEDKFILAAGTTYAEDSEGGEATHILTLSELPSAELRMTSPLGQTLASEYGGETGPLGGVSPNTGNPSYEYKANLNGGNQPHNTMPPYVAKKYWERTA